MTAPPLCTKFVALTPVWEIKLPEALAASVPPLKFSSEPTPPSTTEETFVSAPPANKVTELLVAAASLPMVSFLLPRFQKALFPPMETQLLLALAAYPTTLSAALNA